MKKGILLSVLCLCLFLNWPHAGQQEKHEVEVRLVLVDVIATKDGEFVKDLTINDFEIKEDGKKVAINSFELIDFEEREISIEKHEPQSSERPQKKLAVIFDGINAWEKDIQENIDRIVDELVPLVKLGNEVMVCQLNEAKGVEVLLPFSSDEGAIRTALARATGNMWNPGQALFSTKIDEWARVKDPWYIKEAPMLAEEPRSKGDDPKLIWNLQLSSFLAEERLRFEKTIGGMFAACGMLGSLPGRKSLLFISGGIPDLSPTHVMPKFIEDDFHPGTAGFKPDADTANAMRQSTIDTGDMGRTRLFDPFQLEEKKEFTVSEEVIRELIRYANAHNVSIYSLDAGVFSKYLFPGTASAASIDERDVQIRRFISKERIKRVQNLSWLSEDTGADALRGAGKYDQFRQVMSSDLNYYYQLSFYPRRKKADDKYHKINVKVKRGGIDIRHRKGYTDYSKEGANRLKLITAFYNPSLYKELPIEGVFIPFVNDSGKYVPWMNIALPTKELFLDKRESYLHIPEFKDLKEEAIFNCVLGDLVSNQKKQKKNFSLSKKDGGLEYGKIKFYPKVTNQFLTDDKASVFIQVYFPQGKKDVLPDMFLMGEDEIPYPVETSLVAEYWNEKNKIWSGLYSTDFSICIPGKNSLIIEFPNATEDSLMKRQLNMTIIQ